MADNPQDLPARPAPMPISNDTVRINGFLERYANNVRFESSVWDLKLIFGQLDQTTKPLTIRQHTTINVPWAQVKLMAYLCFVNATLHELRNGVVSIPEGIIPPPIAGYLGDLAGKPGVDEAVAFLDMLRDKITVDGKGK